MLGTLSTLYSLIIRSLKKLRLRDFKSLPLSGRQDLIGLSESPTQANFNLNP